MLRSVTSGHLKNTLDGNRTCSLVFSMALALPPDARGTLVLSKDTGLRHLASLKSRTFRKKKQTKTE